MGSRGRERAGGEADGPVGACPRAPRRGDRRPSARYPRTYQKRLSATARRSCEPGSPVTPRWSSAARRLSCSASSVENQRACSLPVSSCSAVSARARHHSAWRLERLLRVRSAQTPAAYWRTVSSMRYRRSPGPSRDGAATRRAGAPPDRARARRRPRAHPSTASSVAPPGKTESRASNAALVLVRRSKLQSIVSRNVCCRAGRSRGPAREESEPLVEPLAQRPGVSVRTRAAASSIASGSPSTRRQISRGRPRSPASARTTARGAARAATKSSTASASRRGATGKTCSPETWSTARLVTSIVRRGARATQLGVERRRLPQVLRVVHHEQQILRPPPPERGSRTVPHRDIGDVRGLREDRRATSAGSRSGASSTSTAPLARGRRRPRAASSASRVLPLPPAPVSTMSRDVVALEHLDELRQLSLAAYERRRGHRERGSRSGARRLHLELRDPVGGSAAGACAAPAWLQPELLVELCAEAAHSARAPPSGGPQRYSASIASSCSRSRRVLALRRRGARRAPSP